MYQGWIVFEIFKGSRRYTVADIETVSAEEIKEGLIEYLLMRERTEG